MIETSIAFIWSKSVSNKLADDLWVAIQGYKSLFLILLRSCEWKILRWKDWNDDLMQLAMPIENDKIRSENMYNMSENGFSIEIIKISKIIINKQIRKSYPAHSNRLFTQDVMNAIDKHNIFKTLKHHFTTPKCTLHN